jgi:HTH-type transcriptional regulator/antitoxin HigA
MMDSSFNPMWASPPGDTINEILLNKGVSKEQFGENISLSGLKVLQLIEGKQPITNRLAEKLELALGSTKAYWLEREAQYKKDLLRLSEERAERQEWLKLIPTSDMLNYGWIDKTYSKEMECLKFFGVSTVDEWYRKYNDILAVTSFRTSASFDSTSESVVTWLRRGEIESKRMELGSWSQSSFILAVQKARELTIEKDPQIFIPKLQKIFALCGVAVVVEKAPKRCRASGAAYFISPKKAIIMISGRFLSDDHFWFSFFHEAGHILLHGNMKFFLEFEGKDKNINKDKEEREADAFAGNLLIPEIHRSEFLSLNSREWKKIVRFARKIGTSSGVVLGQLQHLNKIDHRYLNKLKNRYKWSGTDLTSS